jgi:MSHA biogenesis protein MshN
MGFGWIYAACVSCFLLEVNGHMSLLNEMLRDLNKDKSRDKLPFSLIIHEKSSYFQSLSKSLPLIFFVFSCILFGLLLIFYKGKLAPSTLSISTNQTQAIDLTKSVTQSVLSTAASPEMGINLVAHTIEETALDWRPSVLVPVPIFKESPIDSVFAENIEAPLLDEENGVNKVFPSLSTKEWYNEQFNKALDYIEAGNNHEAIYVLELILLKFPTSNDVRESLAAVYISEDEVVQAENIINEGLRIQPMALNLNLMKARILYEQNKAEEALAVLSKFRPNIKEEPDFYGLRAALLQSLGHSNEAGSLYKSLIELEPSNSQYWLGYAIALEEKNALQQAVAAYKKVEESYDADPAVRSYAEERLKSLQG